MGCDSCASGGCSPKGCNNNGSCITDGGCEKLLVYDWLSDMALPETYTPFPIIEVKFKGSRKDFYHNTHGLYLEMGDLIVVEGNPNGQDVGHVSLTGELVRLQIKKKNIPEDYTYKKILRKASPTDTDKWAHCKKREYEIMHQARAMALNMQLNMKLSDVDFQADHSKATFYYTADTRIDFRELIKKLAESFRIRIEMRQIGMRQESSRLGGIGSCGRQLCCSTWLTDFKTISTSAARYQNLSLNTLKLAGQCGKLKCCLNYELNNYMDALKHIPKRCEVLLTESGQARLEKTDIFKQIMWFSYAGSTDWIPVNAKVVSEIMDLNKQGKLAADLKQLGIISSPTPIEKTNVPSYKNVIMQDSLTRLDDRKLFKKKKKSRSKQVQSGKKSNFSEKKPF